MNINKKAILNISAWWILWITNSFVLSEQLNNTLLYRTFFVLPGTSVWIRIRIRTGFNQVSGPRSGSRSGFGIHIRIQEGKNYRQKRKEFRIWCFEVLNVLISGLKALPVAWTSFMGTLWGLGIKKLLIFLTQIFFSQWIFLNLSGLVFRSA